MATVRFELNWNTRILYIFSFDEFECLNPFRHSIKAQMKIWRHKCNDSNEGNDFFHQREYSVCKNHYG